MYVNRCSGVNCHYVNKTADYETNVSRSLSPCIVMTTTITIDVYPFDERWRIPDYEIICQLYNSPICLDSLWYIVAMK